MKKILFVLTAMVTLAFVSCNETPYMPSPGDNDMTKNDTMPEIADPDPDPDPEGIEIPEGAINVNEAVKIGKKLAAGQTTEQTYYIKGWVRNFDEEARSKSEPDWETSFAKYGNDYVHMSAREDGQGLKDFYCYRVLGRGAAKLPNHDVLQIGDFIVVKCKIQNYSGTIESSGTCSIEVSNNEAYNAAFPPIDTVYATCAQAKEVVATMQNNETTNDIYVIEGYVQSEGYDATISRGQQKFIWLDDVKEGTKAVQGYYCNVPNGVAVPIGTKVRMIGPITKYNGNPEIKNGNVEIIEE